MAILGLVPMSLSSGVGAETQRPLATVVVGGLITSTLPTLVLPPVPYEWQEPRAAQGRRGPAMIRPEVFSAAASRGRQYRRMAAGRCPSYNRPRRRTQHRHEESA